MFRIDALADIRYDPKTKRYRVTAGVGKGKLISKKAFLFQTQKHIDTNKNKLLALGDALSDGKIDIQTFQRDMASILKELWISNAILGKDGFENVTSEDWLAIGSELKRQYNSGIDPVSGKRFGIKELTKQILSGEVSKSQLNRRLKLYAEASKQAYWKMQGSSSEKIFARRFLGIAEHCQDCLNYALMGVQLKSNLPIPGTNCRCLSQCKCSLKLYTLEEAIAAGYNHLGISQ